MSKRKKTEEFIGNWEVLQTSEHIDFYLFVELEWDE